MNITELSGIDHISGDGQAQADSAGGTGRYFEQFIQRSTAALPAYSAILLLTFRAPEIASEGSCPRAV
jgi:hypothetical protein